MMKPRTSFLTRCLAMALALVLTISNVTPGLAVKASAAENTTTAGAVIAGNYDLTDAEKALLASGYLAGDYDIEIPAVSDSWVAVDTDKNITANAADGWVATTAEVIEGTEVVETVTLTDGKGKITKDGNAFSVKVNYELTADVENQEAMLAAGAYLKQAVANMDAGYACDTNLGIMAEDSAMDMLKQLAAGMSMSFGPATVTAEFADAADAAIYALADQIEANGKLNLQVLNAEYASGAKTAYAIANGAKYGAEAEATKALLETIQADPLMNNTMLDSYLQVTDAAKYTLWSAFKGILNKVIVDLEAPASASWELSNVVRDDVDYAALDALVAALGGASSVSVKNPLVVAAESVTANLNMKNVAVEVVLKTVGNDDAVHTGVVTLSDGATAEEIAAEAATVEAAAIAAWGEAFAAEHFEKTASELPGTLTEDITYTITYSPKSYTVTGGILDGEYLYGTEVELPEHDNPEKAYDYLVNGEKYAQGETFVVAGDTTVTRTLGKSYSAYDLYSIVADNYGDEIAKAILKSGALLDNAEIRVRKPDATDSEDLLLLELDTLTAKNYPSDYEGLEWVPYTYGENGTENTFSGNTASWDSKSVKVQYKLALTNFGQAKAQEILNLVATLVEEAAEQKFAMDSIAGLDDTLGMLDKTKFGALNGVIDVTDFDANAAKNEAIKAELKRVVGLIVNNNLDGNNYLKIYNMAMTYLADGMQYYYKNYDVIKAEVESLAGYMSDLMKQEEALKIMCNAAGFPQYADKISDLEGKLNTYLAAMSAPNAKIDVQSESLGKLVAALAAEDVVTGTASGAPYLVSANLTAQDNSQRSIQIIIETPNGSATVGTDPMDRGTVLTADIINGLNAEVTNAVDELLKGNNKYYSLTVEGSALDSLLDTELNDNVYIYYFYEYKEFSVKIDGEANQVVTINDLEINLPKHPTQGHRYEYTVDGVDEIVSSTYTFTVEQLNRLFAAGSYTITRIDVDEYAEKLNTAFTEWVKKDAAGNVISIDAAIDANKDGVMGFAMTFVNAGYNYIALNNEPLMYMAEDDTLEICVQTLVNAMLNDNGFDSDRLIALGKNGEGVLVDTKIDLGNSADEIHYNDLPFELYLNTVPSQMTTVANGLEKIEDYMTFNANNGVMDVNVNLPEKVYEVYLAALLATDNVDKSDLNAINSEIAYQFLWDYTEIIKNTDVSTQSFTNTLKKIGIDKDLTGAEKYFDLVQKALTNSGVSVNPDKNGRFDMSVTAKSKAAIDKVINVLGIDVSAFELYMGMIKEYKYDNAVLSVAADANLVNTGVNYEAAILDVRNSETMNVAGKEIPHVHKFDFTPNLVERAKTISGEAAIILLDDVNGDLTFKDATILDLNGKTVNGNITANGTTLIIDSSMDTFNCGGVNGTVSGNATIIGGNYTSDVTAFLPDGFIVEGTTVRNVLYTTTEDGNGNVTFWADADILNKDIDSYTKAAVMIAADMAVDLALNYYTAASLTADGYSLYNIHFDDIIGWYDSTNRKAQLVGKALECVNLADLNGFINEILDQMLDFAAIEKAIDNDTNIVEFEATIKPWNVAVDHVKEGDYITFGIEGNADKAKTFTVGLGMAGSEGKQEYAANFAGGLSDIVDTADAEVEIEKPSYSNKHLTVSGNGSATLIIDVTKDNNTENDTSYDYENYLDVLAVVIAHGIKSYDSIKAEKLIAAIGYDDAMKTAIDSVTIEDLFNGLKKMQVAKSFDEMAKAVGATMDMGDAAELEAIYHLIANAAGEGLEKLNLTGTNRTLGSLYNDATGYYELPTFERKEVEKSITKRGYTLTVGAEITKVTLKVKLFADDCKWGDANHDGEINSKDALLVVQYRLGTLAEDQFFCTKRTDVNQDGAHNSKDSLLIVQARLGQVDLPTVK